MPGALLIDFLEEETGVHSTSVVNPIEEGVGLTSKDVGDCGMLPFAQVVREAVDDEVVLEDGAGLVARGRGVTNRFGESEREETDACHERDDDGYQSHLFSPGALLFGGSDG